MSKHELTKNKDTKVTKRKGRTILAIIIVLAILAVIAVAVYMVYNHFLNERPEKTNLIINNRNVTNHLKADVYIENNVIYLSQGDISNFFDSTIYYDEKYDQIITSSYDKLAAMPIGENQIEVNSSNMTISAPVIEKEDTYYIPFFFF